MMKNWLYLQGDSRIDDQKNQGGSWLLVHIWISSDLAVDKLSFEKQIPNFSILMPIFILKVCEKKYITSSIFYRIGQFKNKVEV